MSVPRANVVRVRSAPPLQGPWDHPDWRAAAVLDVGHFRPEGSDHRPRVQVRVVHDGGSLYALFRVEDRFVRAVHRRRNDPVYQDSCVEVFLQPVPGGPHQNFEMNINGAWLSQVVGSPARFPDGGVNGTPLSDALAALVRVETVRPVPLPADPAAKVEWLAGIMIPRRVLEVGGWPDAPLGGTTIRGNFYKCADLCAQPHWGAWAPVAELDFHRPGDFGELVLEA